MILVIAILYKSSVHSYWLLCMKLKYSQYISYAMQQYEVERYACKGKVIGSVIS